MTGLSRMQGNSMHICYLYKPKEDYRKIKKTSKLKANLAPPQDLNIIFKIRYSKDENKQKIAKILHDYFNDELSIYAQTDLKYNSKKDKQALISLLSNQFDLDYSSKPKTLNYAIHKSLAYRKTKSLIIFDFDKFLYFLKNLQTNKVLIFRNAEKKYFRLATTLHNILSTLPISHITSKTLAFSQEQTSQIFSCILSCNHTHCTLPRLFNEALLIKYIYNSIKIEENTLVTLNIGTFVENFINK